MAIKINKEHKIDDILDVVNGYQHLFGLSKNGLVGYSDLIFIDYALEKFSNVKNIIEFGTYFGTTSLYLGMIAKIRNGFFYTVDVEDRRFEDIKNSWLNNMEFIQLDLLEECHSDHLSCILNKDNSMLIIDNGNKVYEFNKYVPLVPKGTLILVHDWNREIFFEDIEKIASDNKLIPFGEQFNNIVKSIFKGFIKDA